MIKPRARLPQSVEVLAVAHIYGGQKTLNGKPEDLRMAAKPGEQVRVRVINTDNGPIETWAGSPYRVLAIDGYDVHEPTDVIGKASR